MIHLLESIADHLEVDMKGLALIVIAAIVIIGIFLLITILHFEWYRLIIREGLW